ncbi:MAG: acyl-CoA dehydrogenase, partial [Candidatus Dadabacteria bacterium]
PYTYYEEHQIFADTVRKYIRSKLEPHIDEWEEAEYFPNSVFSELGEQGFLGILVPETYGGIGGDYKMAAAWCEAFGELCSIGLTVGVNMHSLVVSHALSLYGSEELKKKWLPLAVKGEKIGAYAFTEPGAGSDLANISTKAQRKNGRWILEGTKIFITNGSRADFILVLAKTDPSAGYKGFTTFVVDTSLKGFSISRNLKKLGWKASDTSELVLDGIELGDECVLGQVGEGWIQASKNLNWERVMLILTSLAGARKCFVETYRYAQERKAFGRPIGEIPAVKDILENIYAKLKLSESLSHFALDAVCSSKHSSEKMGRLEVSLAKRYVCDTAVWIADRCLQIYGGYGYTTEFPVERWLRDLRLMPIGGGTSEIMAHIALKELGVR